VASGLRPVSTSGCAVIHSLPASRTAHNPKRCVVMARATFRQRPPTRGIRAPASDRRRPELLQQPQRLGLDVSTIAAHPRAACALERFLKNRSRGRQVTRTLSTAFPNSRSRTPPRSGANRRVGAHAAGQQRQRFGGRHLAAGHAQQFTSRMNQATSSKPVWTSNALEGFKAAPSRR
jgi:hypothetical protein